VGEKNKQTRNSRSLAHKMQLQYNCIVVNIDVNGESLSRCLIHSPSWKWDYGSDLEMLVIRYQQLILCLPLVTVPQQDSISTSGFFLSTGMKSQHSPWNALLKWPWLDVRLFSSCQTHNPMFYCKALSNGMRFLHIVSLPCVQNMDSSWKIISLLYRPFGWQTCTTCRHVHIKRK